MEKCKLINHRKVAIVGCGFVGAASAFALMESGLFSEMVLVDAHPAKAEGEALDISHGLPFAKPMQIHAGGYEDLADASLIIVTAGAAQKVGETRLDLIKKNIGIFASIIHFLTLCVPRPPQSDSLSPAKRRVMDSVPHILAHEKEKMLNEV